MSDLDFLQDLEKRIQKLELRVTELQNFNEFRQKVTSVQFDLAKAEWLATLRPTPSYNIETIQLGDTRNEKD